MHSIELNEEQIAAIEEMAYHGFSFEEISEVIDPICSSIFVQQFRITSLAQSAYRKGFLRSQLELRQRIFKDAKHGSSPAQAMAKKILDDAEHKIRFYE